MAKLFLIDGNAYIHRAYHAIPPLTNSKGEMVNAVYGFIRMMLKILRSEKPDYAIVCFDYPAPTFRHKSFKEYKANRVEIDDELKNQMPLAREAAKALNLFSIEKAGYEADDLIATLAHQAKKDDVEVVIVSGDKDVRQLVDKGIKVWDEGRNIFYDREKVVEKYGLEPKQLVDMFSLMGDASDNIPGIRGVGEKTAIKLIKEYESLEKLLKNTKSLTGKLQSMISDNSDDALKSKELVTLCDDAPIDILWKHGLVNAPDKKALEEFLNRMEFKSLIKEISSSGWTLKSVSPVDKKISTKIILETKALDKLIAEIKSKGLVSVDLETTSTDPLNAKMVGISISIKATEAYYIPVGHSYLGVEKQLPINQVLEKLKPILQDSKIKKYGQNLKYEILVFKKYGVEMEGIYFDSMVASYCLNPSRFSHGLKSIALDFVGFKMTEIEELIGKGVKQTTIDNIDIKRVSDYAGADAVSVLMLAKVFIPELKEKKLDKLFYEVEMPLVNILAEMENLGIKIDIEHLRDLSKEFQNMLNAHEKSIYSIAKQEFNPNSPKQVAAVLFEKLKLPVVKKTKTGYSTDEEVLLELSKKHDLPKKLLEYREIQKLKSTYIDALISLQDSKTGRIHTSFNQAVTSTGRLSSTEPNMQNIPVRSEYGRKIRSIFIPEKNHILLSADYSQIDLRALAHISNDEVLIKAFKNNEDIHKTTAKEVFDVSDKEIDDDLRRIAKSINFGIVYGISPYGLAQQLDIPNEKAKDYIDRYFNKYKGVKKWIDNLLSETRKTGYVSTLLGRIRYLPDINAKNGLKRGFAERMAMNTPIQGTSADIIKVAMINLVDKIDKENIGIRMLLQVHDELLFEIKKSDLDEAIILIKNEMENAVKLNVPVLVDIKTGKNWSDMDKIK
ncbi:DNA polymerase I [Elusimicrobiota bacterium]